MIQSSRKRLIYNVWCVTFDLQPQFGLNSSQRKRQCYFQLFIIVYIKDKHAIYNV